MLRLIKNLLGPLYTIYIDIQCYKKNVISSHVYFCKRYPRKKLLNIYSQVFIYCARTCEYGYDIQFISWYRGPSCSLRN